MNIGFDLDNTLLNIKMCERESILEALIEHEILKTREDNRQQELLHTYEKMSSYHWGQIGEKSPFEVIQRSISDLLKDYSESFDASLITKSYWEFFCRSSQLEPGAREVLESLSKKHRLFCLTNGYSESQRGRLKAAKIEHYFEEVFISEEIGVAKPNPKAVEICLEKLDLSKEKTIYIGDSIINDYPAANGAGIHFYYYNPTNSETSERKGLTQISYLQDLLDIL